MYDVEDYPNINRIWSAILIDNLVSRGINNFFTSPGLRNAPLLSAISLSDSAKAHSGIDERSMAYRALGYAKATGRPGVLVCTSGTAMANYLPAVIEAYQTNIPLIVLSADRPKRLVEKGDNQAILQSNIFSDYLRAKLLLEVPATEIEPQEFADKLNRFLNSPTIKGPLHINFPFEEPLDLARDNTSNEYRTKAYEVNSSISIEIEKTEVELPSLDVSQKTLLVVGTIPEYEKKNELKDLIAGCQLPVLLDIGSGLKFSNIDSSRVLPSFEHPEIKKILEENKPDLIVHVGGRLASKHYYNYLRENPDIKVMLIGNEGQYTHPAGSPTWEIKTSIANFCLKADQAGLLKNQTPYTFDCKTVVGFKEDVIEHSSFSFPSISKRVVELLPEKANLYLGNSTTIRSFDAFASIRTHGKEINVLSHRGASGIEGFNSAALGYAEASNDPTILVHGDIGFMHDLGSMLMYENKKIPLVNLVVNNNGGGIFKHLPISQDTEALPLITTEHERDFEGLCKWLGIDYFRVESISQLESAFTTALRKQSICFIEAIINQDDNLAVYERLKTLKL